MLLAFVDSARDSPRMTCMIVFFLRPASHQLDLSRSLSSVAGRPDLQLRSSLFPFSDIPDLKAAWRGVLEGSWVLAFYHGVGRGRRQRGQRRGGRQAGGRRAWSEGKDILRYSQAQQGRGRGSSAPKDTNSVTSFLHQRANTTQFQYSSQRPHRRHRHQHQQQSSSILLRRKRQRLRCHHPLW